MGKRSRGESKGGSVIDGIELRCNYCGRADKGENSLLPFQLGDLRRFHATCMTKYTDAESVVKNRVYELVLHGKHMRSKSADDAKEEGGSGSTGMDRDALAKEVFVELDKRYSESTRYYHTLTHIADLLNLSASADPERTTSTDHVKIADIETVDWAILYHDIIYDAKSGTNEEDSAQLFKDWATKCKHSTEYACYLSEECVDKVYDYIIATKLHDAWDSTDRDLQIFIDFDMSIVGRREIADYETYMRKVRQEYCHVSQEYWVHGEKGRANFLRRTLKMPLVALSSSSCEIETGRETEKRTSGSKRSKKKKRGGEEEQEQGEIEAVQPIFVVPELRARWQGFAERNMKAELAALEQSV